MHTEVKEIKEDGGKISQIRGPSDQVGAKGLAPPTSGPKGQDLLRFGRFLDVWGQELRRAGPVCKSVWCVATLTSVATFAPRSPRCRSGGC